MTVIGAVQALDGDVGDVLRKTIDISAVNGRRAVVEPPLVSLLTWRDNSACRATLCAIFIGATWHNDHRRKRPNSKHRPHERIKSKPRAVRWQSSRIAERPRAGPRLVALVGDAPYVVHPDFRAADCFLSADFAERRSRLPRAISVSRASNLCCQKARN
jgi:hypothetical protein